VHTVLSWETADALLALTLPGSTAYLPDRIGGLDPGTFEPFDVDRPDGTEVEDDLLVRCAGMGVVVWSCGGVAVARGRPLDPAALARLSSW
jgi:hypothetical protein